MKRSDFTFDLPEHLIAQTPPAERGQSRLMVLDRASRSRTHHRVTDLPDILGSGLFGTNPLLVFNNTRVRKARLLGISKQTGARVAFLLLNKLDEGAAGVGGCRAWKAMVQRSKRRRVGSRYVFAADSGSDRIAVIGSNTVDCESAPLEAEITGEEGDCKIITFDRPIDDAWLDIHGHIPLPPYIKRADTTADSDRYQTVYAKTAAQDVGPGISVAAPTAGLHFTREILAGLADRGIETAFVTLHVGLGTFLPVRAENIEDHLMHEEFYAIDEKTAAQVTRAKAEGRRIIAVGTTSVRTLESAFRSSAGNALNESARQEDGPGSGPSGPAKGYLPAGEGSTSIFIYPGYRFKAVDALFTNFHTPESTLLMLVSAFAGRPFILESYAEAVREGYRFFSYGDAMLIR
ncbi:S-adenosylmethionine:tRNA ribosyltransferase-isomerase [Spirochaetia bacterium]|nr:S-adenosylmethionine:tRNA ribosyltransferase-isomerase [Spirochaetia bacterium]